MTREQAKQLLPIITAFAEGKEIQFRENAGWADLAKNPSFCSGPEFYRIKPKPMEFWINDYGEDGLRIHPTQCKADENRTKDCVRVIHVREVLP